MVSAGKIVFVVLQRCSTEDFRCVSVHKTRRIANQIAMNLMRVNEAEAEKHFEWSDWRSNGTCVQTDSLTGLLRIIRRTDGQERRVWVEAKKIFIDEDSDEYDSGEDESGEDESGEDESGDGEEDDEEEDGGGMDETAEGGEEAH
jgi:hypothetical protein